MADESKDIYYVEGTPVPETPLPGKEPPPWKETTVVGKALPRVDAYERASGTAVYPSDVHLPNMLHGALLRCPHAHARIRRVDTGAAAKLPGVRVIVTGNTPGADLLWKKDPAGDMRLFESVCRFEGDVVAGVAAETPYQAWDAVHAIRVDYEVLPFVADEREALRSNAAPVHPKGNLSKQDRYERGDVAQGFAAADVVLEESYRTECELHTPMEPHGCVANWDGRSLTVWESSQGVYAVQARVAEVLGLPLARVRAIGHYMGGGFGSKLEPGKYTVIAALMAKLSGRPVRLFLTREETYLSVGNRPPTNMTVKAGVKRDGTLTALEFTVLGTGGAYTAGGTALVDWLARDLYTCPNVRTTGTDVFVNAGPSRAFRAPGHPQGAWALEQMMDALAEAIGMDPIALRLKNIPTFSQAREGNPPYTSSGFKECLEKGASAFGWDKARGGEPRTRNASRHVRRGVGVAGGLWYAGGGRPPSTVILKLFSDGSANLNMGASDLGTGTKTVMAMVVAEELGIKPEAIQIECADTGTTQYATPSGGSKTVPTEAPAVRNAAVQVKQKLLEMAAAALKVDASELTYRGREIATRQDPSRRVAVKDLEALKRQGVVMGIGTRGPNPPNVTTHPFAAQFCEVEVNTLTGEVKILRFLAAQDSGRVMNRLTYANQVIGGITMGIGLAATEQRILDSGQTGKMVNRNWHDYKLPTALDVPVDAVVLPIEPVDTANNTGAKGLGEPATIPAAAAIANAVYHATGLRITGTPINPQQLVQRLADRPKEG